MVDQAALHPWVCSWNWVNICVVYSLAPTEAIIAGPCQIDMEGISPNGTTWNPYSWNAEANIFFLDQPYAIVSHHMHIGAHNCRTPRVGVGFSYADYGETVETTEDAARNVYAFITIFFETFSEFAGRPLHLAGESYAGKYLPVFASYIYDQNRVANAAGRNPINLQSVLIGNGITDISTYVLFVVPSGLISFISTTVL